MGEPTKQGVEAVEAARAPQLRGQLGQVLLEHANYDARTAAAYRSTRGRSLPAPVPVIAQIAADAA